MQQGLEAVADTRSSVTEGTLPKRAQQIGSYLIFALLLPLQFHGLAGVTEATENSSEAAGLRCLRW